MRKATGSYRTYSSLVKLQPRFLGLQWKTCLWAELQPWCPSLQRRTCPWAEHMMMMMMMMMNVELTPPRIYNTNTHGSDACSGSNILWTRTLDRYTRAGLPECVVSTTSGPPPEKRRIYHKGHTPSSRMGIKISDPAENRTRNAVL